ncbi:uncharacterized protein [Prorops nasuta]|uniref:uncharacterized protein n=1 Tax=Prorops nasuta TaxID=863751 RepID=UPI0034CE61C0
MLKKLLTKSGRRLMRAIKKLSTKSHKKQLSSWQAAIPDIDAMSLSWSLPSLDAKSIDTYMTYVGENEDCNSRCCHCCENEENQRNENRENEMIL